MPLLTQALIGLVAVEHACFMYAEMFTFGTPSANRAFGIPKADAAIAAHRLTRTLAKNQGCYNGFLVAGLVWSLTHTDIKFATELAYFFLSCVGVAALYGGATAARKIWLVQGAPALAALASLWAYGLY
ncbi:uncharacterized protein EV422DRAFT_537296 [Fimicolochytrium jonesii]|uniref:uncharacterized protein n=1 Tax=Fimicolochytrium jonesii TaxID=1396493 RepID=UPI0022FE8A69|nr:uncharacterized protein EV422DRAFT_537296 [Fimicolochytrium jonesii]KAI8818505.1 hypothetical protein EV422DRAFT_537296 [Fimicolochytrium jonesii]